MIIQNERQYREMNSDGLSKLGKSMQSVGDISGICINLGLDFPLDESVIDFVRKNNVQLVTGHQRAKVIDLSIDKINLLEQLKKPNSTGTIATGFVIHKGDKYNVRFCMWTSEQEQHALVASNELRGKTIIEQLSEISEDILEEAVTDINELIKVGQRAVDDFEKDSEGDIYSESKSESMDYSDKNREIDIDSFEDVCKLVLKYPLDVYKDVREKLNEKAAKLDCSIEDVVLDLLK